MSERPTEDISLVQTIRRNDYSLPLAFHVSSAPRDPCSLRTRHPEVCLLRELHDALSLASLPLGMIVHLGLTISCRRWMDQELMSLRTKRDERRVKASLQDEVVGCVAVFPAASNKRSRRSFCFRSAAGACSHRLFTRQNSQSLAGRRWQMTVANGRADRESMISVTHEATQRETPAQRTIAPLFAWVEKVQREIDIGIRFICTLHIITVSNATSMFTGTGQNNSRFLIMLLHD